MCRTDDSAIQPLMGSSSRRSRQYGGRPLVDLGGAQALALGHLLTSPPLPMADAAAPLGPGTYALTYSGANSLLAAFAAHGSVIYVGSGMLRERWRAHLASLEDAEGLAPEDFAIRLIPYEHHALAELAERLLIDALHPVLNEASFSGFGSRPQGERRQAQTASPFDVLFPGRPGRAQPTEHDRERRSSLQAALRRFSPVPLPTLPA